MIADAGFWIALDRGDPIVRAMLEELIAEGVFLQTSAAVVAQIWRGGPRAARLAMALQAADVVGLTTVEAREVGVLLGERGGSDVVDGHLALLARRDPSRRVLTSDRGDLEALGVQAGRIVDI